MKRTRFLAARGAQLLATFASVASIASVAMFAACSSSDRAPSAGGTDFRPPVEGAGCVTGQVRQCGFPLGTHDGVVDCAVGTQACELGTWGPCVPGSGRTKALAPPPAKPGLGTNALAGSATTCVDNPCNPYCKTFDDVPDSAIVSDSIITTTMGETVTLATSPSGSPPTGFAMKGSDDNHWCGNADPAKAAAACQYDQRCGTDKECVGSPWAWTDASGVVRCCVGFAPGEIATGCGAPKLPDITSPPVCTPSDSTKRAVAICNRGEDALDQEVKCYSYPGNAPQFGADPPNTSPGAGALVLDTGNRCCGGTCTTGSYCNTPSRSFATSPLKPGDCRAFWVPSGNFPSSGNTSVMCNVPDVTGATTTVRSIPTNVEGSAWTNASLAISDTDLNASATALLARTSSSNAPSGPAGTTSDWTNTVASGVMTSSVTAFTDDTATGTNVFSTSTVPGVCGGSASTCCRTSSGASCGTAFSASSGTIPDAVEAGGGAKISASPAGTSDSTYAVISGVSFSGVPSTATISSMTITPTWTVDNPFDGYIKVYKSDGTLVASVRGYRSGSATVTTSTTFLGGVTGADLPNLKIVFVATRTGSGGGSVKVEVDAVSIGVSYFNGPVDRTVELTFPSFAGVPSGATIDSMTVTGNAAFNAANNKGELGIQPVLAVAGAQAESVVSAGGASGTIAFNRPWAGSFTAADFAAGSFKLRLRGTRGVGTPNSPFTLTASGLAVNLFYRIGTNEPTLKFSNFGFMVPAGATNVNVRTLAHYKVETQTTAPLPATFAATDAYDWLEIGAYKSPGLALADRLNLGLVYGGGTACAGAPCLKTSWTANAEFQVGNTFIVNPADLDDANFAVTVKAGRDLPGTGERKFHVDYVRAEVTYQGNTSGNVKECNGANNWTSLKDSPAVPCDPVTVITTPPWTYTRVFESSCPTGTKAKWSRFGYTTTTPADSRIEFRFRTTARDASGACPTSAAVIASPPTPLATARSTPTDTQVCNLSAAPTASCPVDLMTGLGTAAANDCLQLDAYGVPSTGAAPASPVLTDWRVTFDCVPSE